METIERSWAIPIIVIASLFVISGMVAAQDSNEKTGLFMTKGRFALDKLEIDGEIGQAPKGVQFKQGTKILSRR